jgi:hypothetical protein
MDELKAALLAARERDAPPTGMVADQSQEVEGLQVADIDRLMRDARGQGQREGRRLGHEDFRRHVQPEIEARAETRGALVALEEFGRRISELPRLEVPGDEAGDEDNFVLQYVEEEALLSALAYLRSAIGHEGLSGERKAARAEIGRVGGW